jgi:hypothetical protein
MKKIILLAFLIGSAFLVSAQLVLSSGSQIVVNSTSVLVVNDLTTAGGTIKNSGEVTVLGNITNNSGDLFTSDSDGTISFEGSEAQEITGTSSTVLKGTVVINNSTGVALTNTATGAAQSIPGSLTFTSGKLTLNAFTLTLGGTADPTGVGSSAYIVTNGAGQLKRTVASSNILFPVGNSTYNPVTLNNAGVSDTYGVIAVEGKPASFSGTTHIVNESWDVTETDADGSNLTVTTQWNSGDEATFDRTRSSIGLTTDVGANVTWGSIGAASGADPYTRSIAGITSVGTFMVGDYFYAGIPIDIKVMLAAAWNNANNNMDKTINSRIPLADPYTGVDVTVSSIPTDAVDWVKVELRNSGNHATVTNTYAKFVDQDGQIIEEDGSNMKITGAVLGSYYVAVLHRNHLGVVSASTVELASSPAVNFSNLQARAWQSGASNAAMKEVESGVFGLWDGNANGDASIVYNGGSSDRVEILDAVGGVTEMSTVISGVYSGNDVNMDGNIVYNGGSSDRVIILDNVGGVTEMSTTLSANLPD